NSELFRTNYPEAILVVYGDVNQEGLSGFKRQILAAGEGGSWRLPVIEGGSKRDPSGNGFEVETKKLRDSPRDMMMTELIRIMIAMKAAYYRMHPGIINFSTDQQGNAIFESRNETESIALSTEE